MGKEKKEKEKEKEKERMEQSKTVWEYLRNKWE